MVDDLTEHVDGMGQSASCHMEEDAKGADGHGPKHESLVGLEKKKRKRPDNCPPSCELNGCIGKGRDSLLGPVRPIKDIVKEQWEDILQILLASLVPSDPCVSE